MAGCKYIEWMPDIFPVGLKIKGETVLVVGGGRVAARKIRTLLSAGAKVDVIAPRLTVSLRNAARRCPTDVPGGGHARRGRIRHIRSPFRSAHVNPRYRIVFACTDNARVNSRVAAAAAKKRVLANVADNPSAGDLHLPSLARLGGLTLAFFSGGRAPAYVKALRRRLEKQYGDQVRRELMVIEYARARLKRMIGAQAERKRLLSKLINSGRPATFGKLSLPASRQAVERWLARERPR